MLPERPFGQVLKPDFLTRCKFIRQANCRATCDPEGRSVCGPKDLS